jgi:predicted negative regulator of RcsB-dependent stress response
VDEYLNEQEQWEMVRGWLRVNTPWIIAGVLIAAGGVWGWRAWQAHVEARLAQAAGDYQQLIQAFGKNDLAKATALADQISKEHAGTGYADQAQLAAARALVENQQLDAAALRLKAVMASTHDRELALAARLRLARLQIAQNHADEALATLAAVEPGAFAGRYAEVRGDALYAKGDKAGALKAYREAQQGAGEAGDLLTLKINELNHG